MFPILEVPCTSKIRSCRGRGRSALREDSYRDPVAVPGGGSDVTSEEGGRDCATVRRSFDVKDRTHEGSVRLWFVPGTVEHSDLRVDLESSWGPSSTSDLPVVLTKSVRPPALRLGWTRSIHSSRRNNKRVRTPLSKSTPLNSVLSRCHWSFVNHTSIDFSKYGFPWCL